jgi:hypothetical protein
MFVVAKFDADWQRGIVDNTTSDIHSLALSDAIRQNCAPMEKTGQPIVLTVNSKAQLVVQNADSHQKLLEDKDKIG